MNDDNIYVKDLFPKSVLCYSMIVMRKVFLSVSPSRSLCLSPFSHLHRRLICLSISDGVLLTVCCSFPFVVVIFNRTRACKRERERKGSIYDRQRKKEKKKKYYRNGQSHHLSNVCVCRLTCESILSTNIHIYKQNQSTAEENVIGTNANMQ